MEMTCVAILVTTACFLLLNAAAQHMTCTFQPMPSSAAVVETPTPTMPGTAQPPTTECGGMLAGSSGCFASPGFPSKYPNNLNCTWTLRIPANGVLTLNFPVFFIEYGFDFITTTDSSGQIIQRLSGYGAVNNIKVGGNTTQLLNVTFTSDYDFIDRGFLAQYSIAIRSPETHGIFQNVVCNVNTICSLFCHLSNGHHHHHHHFHNDHHDDESVQYNWTKNGQPLTGDDVMVIENVLIVTPRKEDDYGIYVCKATNSAGSVEYKISLEGEANNGHRGSPGVPSVSRNISTPSVACKLETTCTLFCYMSSNESVRYTWTKNGKSVTGNDVTIINNVLLVTPRAEEDYGEYVCTATNSAGSIDYEISLEGSPGVPSVSRNISTPSVACKLETTCTLFCYMSSNESVRYTWTKNGKSMTGNDVTTMSNVLIVTPRAEEDYGVYVCTATNSAGSAEYYITLKKEAKSSTNFNSAKEDEDLEKSLIYVIIALSIVVCILVIAVFGCYFCKKQRNRYKSEKVQAELRVTTFGNPAYTPTEAS